MSTHDAWVHNVSCRRHGYRPCDCDPDMKFDEWTLKNDAGHLLGVVQRFQSDGPFYGTGAAGRTGPMSVLMICQARVEAMLEDVA